MKFETDGTFSIGRCLFGGAPYTLHPNPYALCPTPYTLHPTPYTLHPKPSALHPTLYTLKTLFSIIIGPFQLQCTPHEVAPCPLMMRRLKV